MQDKETAISLEELKDLIREQCRDGSIICVSVEPEGGEQDGKAGRDRLL